VLNFSILLFQTDLNHPPKDTTGKRTKGLFYGNNGLFLHVHFTLQTDIACFPSNRVEPAFERSPPMATRRIVIFLLLITAFLTSGIFADPLCVPPGSAPELMDNPSHGWLTRIDVEQTKAYILKHAPEGSRWEGDALIVRCEMQGSEPTDMTAAYVKGAGQSIPEVSFSRDYFADLARRTGHSPQDADRLYRQYANLQGTYFKQIRDANGGLISEGKAIFDRHKGTAPTAPAAPSAGDRQSAKQKAEELKKKIEAARARGDMQEMMRLAAEAQQMNAPVMQQSDRINTQSAEQQWQMLENAYGELVQAGFRTCVRPAYSTCLQCNWVE